MRKSYFLLYGSSLTPATLLALVGKRLDIEFELHESSYVGEYYKYSGLYADKLTIEQNKIGADEDYKEVTLKDYPTLIYVNISSGKNREKKSKLLYIKRCLREITNVKLLRESEVEDN